MVSRITHTSLMVLFVHMFAFISTQHDSYISQAVNNQSHLITEPWHLTLHTFSSLIKSSGVSELLSGPSTKIVHIKQVNRATHQEGHLQRFSLSDFGMVVHHTEYKCQLSLFVCWCTMHQGQCRVRTRQNCYRCRHIPYQFAKKSTS